MPSVGIRYPFFRPMTLARAFTLPLSSRAARPAAHGRMGRHGAGFRWSPSWVSDLRFLAGLRGKKGGGGGGKNAFSPPVCFGTHSLIRRRRRGGLVARRPRRSDLSVAVVGQDPSPRPSGSAPSFLPYTRHAPRSCWRRRLLDSSPDATGIIRRSLLYIYIYIAFFPLLSFFSSLLLLLV